MHATVQVMNWEPVLTDLFSELSVVAGAAARDAARFSHMSVVSVVADAVCLEAVELHGAALAR
jgi:hypothetical protein